MSQLSADSRHDRYSALACGWTLSALEPEDEVGFVSHLADCPLCERTVVETTRTMADLATALPDAGPPPELRGRLLAAIAAETPIRPRVSSDAPALPRVSTDAPALPGEPRVSTDAPVRPRVSADAPALPGEPPATRPAPARLARRDAAGEQRRPRRRGGRLVAATAAAAAALAGLAAWNVALNDDRAELQRELAQRQATIDRLSEGTPARVAALRAADGSGRRLATVLLRSRGVEVVAEALPPNDAATSTYVLWGLRSRGDTAPVALGTFDVSRNGGRVSVLRATGSTAAFPVLALTREPGRTPPPTRGTLLGIGDVAG